jgi:hypothetical protein
MGPVFVRKPAGENLANVAANLSTTSGGADQEHRRKHR